MLLTKPILKSFQNKREESLSCHALVMLPLSCHALLWSCFHALLHFAMLLLTKSAPKTKIFSSTIDSPHFGDKKRNSLFTVTSHPLLFMTLFTPNFCLFKGGCPLCLKQVLVKFLLQVLLQVFFSRESSF